jgi:hypothetical protein
VGFCSACAEEMKMMHRNKKKSQGDGDVGGWLSFWVLRWKVEGGGFLCYQFWDGEWRAGQFVRVRLIAVFIALLFFWLGRFGSSVLVLKPKPNRTGKILWF